VRIMISFANIENSHHNENEEIFLECSCTIYDQENEENSCFVSQLPHPHTDRHRHKQKREGRELLFLIPQPHGQNIGCTSTVGDVCDLVSVNVECDRFGFRPEAMLDDETCLLSLSRHCRRFLFLIAYTDVRTFSVPMKYLETRTTADRRMAGWKQSSSAFGKNDLFSLNSKEVSGSEGLFSQDSQAEAVARALLSSSLFGDFVLCLSNNARLQHSHTSLLLRSFKPKVTDATI
jgi:hypothetical protein